MLSRDHNTLFVHIPKCAGQSVEMAFLADLGLSWETRAPLLLRSNDRPELGPPRLAHLTAEQYVSCGHVSAEDYARLYKFAIVRDPWSRAVSLYRHLGLNLPFRAFVSDWLPDQFRRGPASEQFWFVRPETDFVYCGGVLAVDDLLRFEHLAEDFPRAAAASGLRTPLSHANRAGHRTAPDVAARDSALRRLRGSIRAALTPDRHERHDDWRDFYDAECIAAVGSLYASDREAFGYAPPRPRDRSS